MQSVCLCVCVVPCGYVQDVKLCGLTFSTTDAPPPYYSPTAAGQPPVQPASFQRQVRIDRGSKCSLHLENVQITVHSFVLEVESRLR